MGQRSDAAFCGSHFWRYFDATQNRTFLSERAYPFLRKVADFYESYIVLNHTTGRYDVLNSCGMEGCGSQDLPHGVASNNSPFDLGLATTLFRKLAAYSALLDVDADRREVRARQMMLEAAPSITALCSNQSSKHIRSSALNIQAWTCHGLSLNSPPPPDHGRRRAPNSADTTRSTAHFE